MHRSVSQNGSSGRELVLCGDDKDTGPAPCNPLGGGYCGFSFISLDDVA